MSRARHMRLVTLLRRVARAAAKLRAFGLDLSRHPRVSMGKTTERDSG